MFETEVVRMFSVYMLSIRYVGFFIKVMPPKICLFAIQNLQNIYKLVKISIDLENN